MKYNSNLIFKSSKHFENFKTIIDSEYPNFYESLCEGNNVDTIAVGYYYILSSFFDGCFLVEHKTCLKEHVQAEFLTNNENLLFDFANDLIDKGKLDFSVLNYISDDEKVLLKTGLDIAYDDLSLSTDVLFDLISTLKQNQIELSLQIVEYELER